MSQYSSIKAAVNAYIKQNGRKEITGKILNAVLNATIDSLGKFYQFAGVAVPTTDPENPDQNVCYLAGEPGTYTHFDNIVLENEEIALLFYNGTWTKQRMLIGIQEVTASVDNQVGTPSVDVSYSEGQLVLTFHNLKGDKGDTGDAAGFGTIGATVDSNIGTPGVSVQTSGTNLEKNIMFNFTNLKGETGVTSVIATVDNTVGTPSCTVSLVGQQLTLAFTGLKGLKGDTGVSADYPITIYNGLDSTATDQALSAYQGKVLNDEITQLEHEVTDVSDELGMEGGYVALEYSTVTKLRIANSPKGKISAMTSAAYAIAYIEFAEETDIKIVHNFGATSTAIGLYGYVDSVEDIVASNTISDAQGTASADAENRTNYYTVPAGKVFVIGTNTNTATKLEISVQKKFSTKMEGLVKGWVIGECFTVVSPTYTDGLINSPVSVIWPDGNTGSLAITRNADNLVVSVVATVGTDVYTLAITRDADGNVTSSSITKTN